MLGACDTVIELCQGSCKYDLACEAEFDRWLFLEQSAYMPFTIACYLS